MIAPDGMSNRQPVSRERSTISGNSEQGYVASSGPYWSPFGAFPFECPSEKDAETMLELLFTLRDEVDRSRSGTHLKNAIKRATKGAARLKAMIEPVDRFENMLRRGYCLDFPHEPLSG